jgi:hypothetical protein
MRNGNFETRHWGIMVRGSIKEGSEQSKAKISRPESRNRRKEAINAIIYRVMHVRVKCVSMIASTNQVITLQESIEPRSDRRVCCGLGRRSGSLMRPPPLPAQAERPKP